MPANYSKWRSIHKAKVLASRTGEKPEETEEQNAELDGGTFQGIAL